MHNRIPDQDKSTFCVPQPMSILTWTTKKHQWHSHWGVWGAECPPWQLKICQKSGKGGRKSGKIRKRRKNQEGSQVLPLLTDRAGYATANKTKNNNNKTTNASIPYTCKVKLKYQLRIYYKQRTVGNKSGLTGCKMSHLTLVKTPETLSWQQDNLWSTWLHAGHPASRVGSQIVSDHKG